VTAELQDTMAECATFLGTARYMAPEALGGNRYSFAADVWSLGVVTYVDYLRIPAANSLSKSPASHPQVTSGTNS